MEVVGGLPGVGGMIQNGQLSSPSKMRRRAALGCAVAMLGGALAGGAPAVTFNREVAPLVFQHCAVCHRPGQPGPFPLLTYADVRSHARQIVGVTSRGYMPPWPPEAGTHRLRDERRLTAGQIQIFADWLAAGTPEGDPHDLPAPPQWSAEWQLGPPDAVARMPLKYQLAADGPDVYRNFVLPVALPAAKYVRAVEFRPVNPRIVHHAFMQVDRRGGSRKLDGRDGQPGFGGMNLPGGVEMMPGDYFLSWQPGKIASAEEPGYGWPLAPGDDFVLEAHLKPSGKVEDLQCEIGLYFTEIAPTNQTVVFALKNYNLLIPPGVSNYVAEDEFILPVPVELRYIFPHAHFLGRTLAAYATRPGGSPEALIRIPDWDFNWQADYRYAEPVRLPAGSTLRMHYEYDNSPGNARNPGAPPHEVRYGPQSADEMAELTLQVRVADAAAGAQLRAAYETNKARRFRGYAEFRLAQNPRDAAARKDLGLFQYRDKEEEAAAASFQQAAADDPLADEPHYYLGLIHRTHRRLGEARTEFETAIRLNPENAKAHGNLALIFMEQGNLKRAERSLREALRLNPADELAREALEQVRKVLAGAGGGGSESK